MLQEDQPSFCAIYNISDILLCQVHEKAKMLIYGMNLRLTLFERIHGKSRHIVITIVRLEKHLFPANICSKQKDIHEKFQFVQPVLHGDSYG